VIVLDPVVNHPHPATLAAALHGVTQLADAAPTFDDVAALWIFCQFGLQPSVRIVGEQRRNQARKCWGFDEFHDVILSANGGYVNLFHVCLSDVSEKQGDVPSFLMALLGVYYLHSIAKLCWGAAIIEPFTGTTTVPDARSIMVYPFGHTSPAF